MSGILYLVATPIGNLEDMTYRAVRILSEVDLIAAEDTRNSIKLLNHFEIRTPMTSYHEFNKYDKAKVLVEKLLEGKNIAVITDAGTPGISDPGEELVKQSLASGITVTSVPGACAAISGLITSGLPTRRFAFEAFLPHDKKEKARILQELKHETRTMVIYEAPHRLKKTLTELYDVLGERNITLTRELTKKHETIENTTFSDAITYYGENEPRGEYVIVIEGLDLAAKEAEQQAAYEAMTIEEHIGMYINQGMSKKEAIKQAAVDRGVPKRDIYNAVEKD
ncbi:MAG: 16S rRNA (cytidine(1402)-2'-O)-methyltransferase [Coprococcus sp.]